MEIPAGVAGTRVGEVVDLRSATQRSFVVEVTVGVSRRAVENKARFQSPLLNFKLRVRFVTSTMS